MSLHLVCLKVFLAALFFKKMPSEKSINNNNNKINGKLNRAQKLPNVASVLKHFNQNLLRPSGLRNL